MSCYQFNSGHDDHVRISRSPGLSFRQFFFFFFFVSPSYPLLFYTCKSIYRHFVGAPFAKILSSTLRFDNAACNVIVTTPGNFRLFGQLWIPKYLIHVELEHGTPRHRYQILRIKGRFGWHFSFVLENELVRITVFLNLGFVERKIL